MFDQFERKVRRTLRRVAKQRIGAVLPGNCWLIEHAVGTDPVTHAALLTCYMRGWVEPLEDAVPSAKIPTDGNLPPNFQFEGKQTFYRLTSAGWSAIHRSGLIAVCALLISALSFATAVAGRLSARPTQSADVDLTTQRNTGPVRPFQYAIVRHRSNYLTTVPDLFLVYR